MRSMLVGFVAGLPVMAVTGPIAVLLWQVGLDRGLRRGLPAAAGVAAADGTFGAIAFIGGVAFQRAVEPVAPALRILAVGVLVVVAVRFVVAGRRELRAAGSPDSLPSEQIVGSEQGGGGLALLTRLPAAPRLGVRFWSLTMCNPMSVGLFASLVVASGPDATHVGWPMGMALASLVAHGGYLALGAGMRSRLEPRHTAWMRVGGGVLLGALAVSWALGG